MSDDRLPARAIWGLHNNRYDLAGRTPSLSDDEARQLRQVPDVGDPIAPVDDAVAHLIAPGWGHVVARYYTDSRHDSAGRLMWVYDVVRPSEEQIARANHNPFALLPPASPNRTIDETGDLSEPDVHAIDEAARLSEILNIASPMIESVLAAVLSAPSTLWLTTPPDAATIEAIVLLLPPELRGSLTFQTYTLRKSDLAPRLVMAERIAGTLRDVQWSYVLPSDQRTIPDAARRVARELIDLASISGAIARAHELYASCHPERSEGPAVASPDLLAECARLLRFYQFDALVDAGDVGGALGVLSEATTDRDRTTFADALLLNSDPQRLGALVASSLRDDDRDERRAAATFLDALVTTVDTNPAARSVFSNVLDAVRNDLHDDDVDTRRALTVIARTAGRHGDVDAAFSVVPVLPHTDAPVEANGSELDALIAVVTNPGSMDIPAVTRIVSQCTSIAPRITTRRARLRFSALVLRAVRAALANANSVRSRTVLVALHAALTRFWNESTTAGELDQALRAFVQDVDARSASVAARLLTSADPSSEVAEIAGWIALRLVDRDDDGRRLRGVAEFLSAVPMPAGLDGWLANLLPSVTASPSDYFNNDWGVVLNRVDTSTRGKIQVDAFVEIVRQAAKGNEIGSIADACSAMATRGVVLTEATIRLVIPALRELMANDTSPFVNFRLAVSLVEQISDGAAIDRLHGDLWTATLDADSAVANLWRTATAQAIARNVLDASYLARLRGAAESRSTAFESLPSGHKKTLMSLLHHASAPFLGVMRRPAFAGRAKRGEAE